MQAVERPNRKRSQMALLHHISRIVSSDLSLGTMLQELVALTVEATACDACLVYLVDAGAGEVVLRATQLSHDAEIGNIRLKIGDGVNGWVAMHRSVVALAAKASEDGRFKSFRALPEDTFEAFLSVPLISRGELIGAIHVHHRKPHAHTPDQIALVSFTGEQMGGAIAKARLVQRSEAAVTRMQALAAVGQAISADDCLDRILQAISQMVAEALDSPLCSITLSERQYRYPELAPETPLASLLSVPLTSRDGVIGAMDIYTREERSFSEDEIGFARVAAGQAVIAIQNARLISETLEMKRTLETRKLVERAKGILQHKHALSEEEAYLRLRNESRRLRRPMKELAEAVILADDFHAK